MLLFTLFALCFSQIVYEKVLDYSKIQYKTHTSFRCEKFQGRDFFFDKIKSFYNITVYISNQDFFSQPVISEQNFSNIDIYDITHITSTNGLNFRWKIVMLRIILFWWLWDTKTKITVGIYVFPKENEQRYTLLSNNQRLLTRSVLNPKSNAAHYYRS
jgi:hypothetical protein